MNDALIATNSYLSFKLEDETFAVEVAKVLEILEIPPITKVPKSPTYMTGVINLRGNVLPVIDTRLKFGMSTTEYTVNTCIVVFKVDIGQESLILGALVDSVQEVLEIDQNQIHPSPSIGNKYRSEFILGMARVNDSFLMILNIDDVFSAEDVMAVKDTAVKEVTE
jgi:purine-binding chemotaxis protein CheW